MPQFDFYTSFVQLSFCFFSAILIYLFYLFGFITNVFGVLKFRKKLINKVRISSQNLSIFIKTLALNYLYSNKIFCLVFDKKFYK